MPSAPPELEAALCEGDPGRVETLIAAGADVRYRDDSGYTALIHGLHGRDVARDDRLLDLLRLLLANGVDPNAVTSYHESALRVSSRLGRFDAVALLLDAGADRSQLGWTPLIEAVALRSLDDVGALVAAGAPLEDVDWWSRTAFLVAVLKGDLDAARLLAGAGANVNARGRVGQPALFFAIAGHHPEAVRWLLEIGHQVDGADDYGTTPLMQAVEHDDLPCIEILLAAGADVARADRGTALERASSRTAVLRLLEAGADPQQLSSAGRRALLGLPPDADAGLLGCTADDYRRAPTRRFGRANPERVDEPFWLGMIRAGITASVAPGILDPESEHAPRPVFCAQRFGQSLTFLPDGRIVQIAGEHEDYYDADFCIYNDVFVHGPDGSIAIYAYPEADFPPTDFHTATLVGDHIYVVGSLGYTGTRRFGETPLYRLDVRSLRMERLAATGRAPGWIFSHRAILVGPHEIQISGGKIAREADGREAHEASTDSFVLDVARLRWRREPAPLTSARRT
jgi:ankyrin repeat protein